MNLNMSREEEERQKLFNLLDKLPSIAVLYSTDYKIIYANRYFREHICEPGEKPCYESIYGRDKPCRICRTYRTLETGEPLDWDNEVEDKIYHFFSFPLEENSSSPVVFQLGIDVTEQRRAESELLRSKSQLSRIADNMLDMIAEFDVKGKYLYASPSYKTILGYNPVDMLGKSALKDTHPDDRKKVSDFFYESIKTSSSIRVEYRYKHIDGQFLWLESVCNPVSNEKGEVSAFIVSSRDITEGKKAKEALQSSEARYRTLIENIPARMFFKDRNLNYVSCNDRYARDLNINANEIAGKSDYEIYSRDIAEQYRSIDKRIMETGGQENAEEKYISNGREMYVQSIRKAVKNDDGEIVGILRCILGYNRAEEGTGSYHKNVPGNFGGFNSSCPALGRHCFCAAYRDAR